MIAEEQESLKNKELLRLLTLSQSFDTRRDELQAKDPDSGCSKFANVSVFKSLFTFQVFRLKEGKSKCAYLAYGILYRRYKCHIILSDRESSGSILKCSNFFTKNIFRFVMSCQGTFPCFTNI